MFRKVVAERGDVLFDSPCELTTAAATAADDDVTHGAGRS